MSGTHVTRSFTLRTLCKNRVRTVVTILGIALSAALLTAVLTTLSSLTSFLYDQETAQQGAWHASVYTTDGQAIENARADSRIGNLSVMTDVGYAHLGEAEARNYGNYVAVQAIDGDAEQLCSLPLSEGRLPQNSHEIVLYSLFQGTSVFSDEPCQIGSQITMDLGARRPLVSDNSDAEGLPDYLDTSFGYFDPQEGSDGFGEEFVDAGLRQTYTVVGFYQQNNMVTAIGTGSKAFTFFDKDTETALAALGEQPTKTVYFTTVGLGKASDIQACTIDLFDATQPRLHSSLLNYVGISDGRALWGTLYQMAAVLAVVIIAASASLIYNSFAISVAERTRQFGLLASIGASRKQLRRMVRFEALLLAIVGIPLGLALGIGGSFVVLEALSPALSEVLGGGARFGLHVDPVSLAVAAVLSLVAVSVSAWLPSRRAARVSAVDAVRSTQDVRLASRGRTGQASLGQASALDDPWKPRGLALGARLLGVPGAIAQRNATRSRGKGRVAVASLLLAVVLLVTAGALNLYLNTTIRVAGDVQPYDIRVQGYSSTEDGSDQFAQDMLDDFATLYATLSDFEGVEAAGSSASLSVPVSIPSSIVGDRVAEGLDSALEMNDGTVETQATLVFVDDESYRAFLEQEGLDPQTYMDPAHPRALANHQVLGNDGSTYQVMDMFVSAGSIQVYAYENREGWYRSGEYLLPNGQMGVAYQKDDGTSMDVAREDGAQPAYTLEIGAVTDEAPAVVGRSSWMPVVMVPQSFASVLGMSDSEASEATGLVFSAAFNAEDHAAAAKDMEAFLDGNTSFGTNVYDAAAEQEQTEMLATVVETFSLCFAGILTLIAVANVFNTLVNSLVLRRREFAVLKSVGMGNKAFNRMIAWECVRYGIRGLAGGLIVSVVVTYLLFVAMETSISGLTFMLPWGHMGIAVLVVILATVASTAYGLHRSRANNVVEALRTDVL